MKKALSVILILFLLLVPITVLRVTPLHTALMFRSTQAELLQRLFALAFFITISVKLILKLKWLTTLSFIVFSFYLLSMALVNYFSGRGLDPFYIFTYFCGYCSVAAEFYYTMGRFVFWILFVGSLSEVFKRKVNVELLDYIVFILSAVDFYFTLPDFKTLPFYPFAIIATVVVVYKIIRLVPSIYRSYKTWLRS